MEKHAYGSWKTQLMLAGLGIVIGALVGCLDTIFGKVLLWVSDIRTAHILSGSSTAFSGRLYCLGL